MKNICLIVFIASLAAACAKKEKDTAAIKTDSLSIVSGQSVFSQNCTACHNFKQDGIGPQLGGLTGKVSADWIIKFIKDPTAVMESDDSRGKQLGAAYHTIMP